MNAMPEQGPYATVAAWVGEHTGIAALRWHRGVGYARHGGFAGWWAGDPPAVARDAQEVEYSAGVVMTIDGREMTAEEQESTARMLAQMANDARDALTGQSTLVVVLDAARKTAP